MRLVPSFAERGEILKDGSDWTGNYGACLRDCSLVLSESHASYPDPPSPASHRTSMKALLRSARALSALDKLPEAMDAFGRLRMLEKEVGEGDSGAKWREETERKVERKERREREERERERRKMEERAAMVLALTVSGRRLLLSRRRELMKDVSAATRGRLPPPNRETTALLVLPNRRHSAPL